MLNEARAPHTNGMPMTLGVSTGIAHGRGSP
jgi:hypothetical protein